MTRKRAMVGRIVDIGENNRYLKVSRGFFVVKDCDVEIGKIPLDDIQAVIAHGHGHTYSQNLLIQLSERGVPLVLCNQKHLPHALMWPLDTHHEQTKRVIAQVDCKKPRLKRAWKLVVQSKILMQAKVLQLIHGSDSGVAELVKRVKSGDSSNVEAWAARRYWKPLLSESFKRDPAAEDINRYLNYGYTLLRSLVARSVAAAGLHPAIGMHHSNRGNVYALVDDLMEPYRPIVDLHCTLFNDFDGSLNATEKAFLARIMDYDLPTDYGTVPLHLHVERLVSSYAAYLLGERDELAVPAALSDLPEIEQ